ncbi:MAG: hypothetical protein J1E01_05815 [Acetatifactor sp.]|nr:hypothetical protein [Acetatifactor sp.]
MDKKNCRIAVSLLILCMVFSGCAGMPPGATPEVFGEWNPQQGQEKSGTVPDSIMASDPGAGETYTLEEYSFLEEGSGFAYRDLSAAEKLWYHDMERILGSYRTEVELSVEALTAGLNETHIDRIFQCVLNDHPELFYVEGYSYTKYTRYGQDDDILSVEFSGRYSIDMETARHRQREIHQAVDEILVGIDDNASQYDKVKYVYDTLIRETDYMLEAEDNQNIYSVFVNHLSVCQGYAKATQYLLNRLGVECALVLGTVETGEGHAWNLVNVDGSYYYVDTTWGDASYQMGDGESGDQRTKPEINYDYLNVTTAELLRTHALDQRQPMPLCIDTAANYYVREGALFDSYDREQMEALFQRVMEQERSDVTIKCATWECYDEIFRALVEEKRIFDYLPGSGQSVAYTQNDAQWSLTFWVTNE